MFYVVYPTHKEQLIISTILSRIDELVLKTGQIIEQTQRLKKGLMQELLTKGTNQLKKAKVVGIEYVELENHVEVRGRIGWKGLKSSEYTTTGPFMISGINLHDGTIAWDSSFHINQFRFDESPEIQLKMNDIVMIKDGSSVGRLGFIDYLPGPSTISSTLVLIRETSGIFHPKFLYYFFQSPSFQGVIKKKTLGLAIPHIFQRDIKQLRVPKLLKHEQLTIVNTLSTLDINIHIEQDNRRILENLKRGLMQKLLTGKISVKI